MPDLPTRLIVAYSLIALLALAATAIAWWNIYHSQPRTEERERIRRRAADKARDKS